MPFIINSWYSFMVNDPELNIRLLGYISADFVKIADQIKETSYLIRQRGISKHPVFPICEENTATFSLLMSQHEAQTNWNYYVSFLEEFEQRELITDRATFLAAWKDPDEFACLFVVKPDFMNFIFVPFPED